MTQRVPHRGVPRKAAVPAVADREKNCFPASGGETAKTL